VLVLSFVVPACATKPKIGPSADLPLPSNLPLVDYEQKLYRWILERKYSQLGWAVDKSVRDTGPYIDGVYYGTHPAVRIYYSPEIIDWLANGRKGTIADGAMIVKEMFTPPATLYQALANDPKYSDPKDYDKQLSKLVGNWTIMVKDSTASSDGWFWGSVSLPKRGQSIKQAISEQVDTRANRDPSGAQLRYSGFAMPCIRCHASAENELTFSELANIKGFPGDPLIFYVDNSWRTATHFSPDPLPNPYPLHQLKDDAYVKSLFELPWQQLPWATQLAQIQPKDQMAVKSIISSDHDLTDNLSITKPAPKVAAINKTFLSMFPEISSVQKSEVAIFPPQWLDHVVMPPKHPMEYVTSDNCMGCHGGLGGQPDGLSMFVKTGPKYGDGYNVSEYGEWRWSPMGLAGRDPIFHAQLESEMAILQNNEKHHPHELKGKLKPTQQAVTDTCLSCHGAMGQRQLATDAKVNSKLNPYFNVDYFYLSEALTEKEKRQQIKTGTHRYNKYGELAREGISCMICHHIDAPDQQAVKNWQPKQSRWINRNTPKELAYTLFHNSTGQFNPGPANEVFGPINVSEKPMQQALNVKPLFNAYTKDSQMCGTCHTINLPNIGMTQDKFPVLTAAGQNTPFSQYAHTIEQATFLEWQNSIFAEVDDKGKPGSHFQSCQDCHMPGGFESRPTLPGEKKVNIEQLVTQIATIQDTAYAEAENTLPNADIEIPLVNTYKRHTHVGLNVFLLEMFNQFDEILGVEKTDYMTSANNGNSLALDNMILQAQQNTVDVSVKIQSYQDNVLTSQVTLRNKTGHRLPSGVAFRRVFIEFVVLDGDKPIWQSGRTNTVGVILGANNEPLKTEFLPSNDSYQHHYQIIDSENQVQIYEELNLNAQNEFTTSFIHRVNNVKDNRLLPQGWRQSDYFKEQGEVMFQFMHATDPEGRARNDKDYQNPGNSLDFAGQDRLIYKATLPTGTSGNNLSVGVTVYSQSIPPYWLKQRFELAPKGKATKRLYYLASHLDLTGTPMENWKLKLVSDMSRLK
jgi:mono/diheme cytochrome c family protein